MQIIDLDESHLNSYFCCLEDWSNDMLETGDHKQRWYRHMQDKGLRVKLAIEDGLACGMIQYLPIEHSIVKGQDLYFIHCIWVHGHKQGVGNRQKRGMGTALLRAAEADARMRGAKGMAAWGLWLPFWMKASWFKKQGFEKVERDGIAQLLWKPFCPDAQPPAWMKKTQDPVRIPGKVRVTAFISGWCQAQNMVFERAKRASQTFGDRVYFEQIDTLDRAVLDQWGIADGLFIDGKQVWTGPPPSYEKILKKIEKRVKKLKT
ncbi:GNAT family N-acetyltransferase [candidate division KSB1 bacterium]|nr:GNAT family N-acetyltransferase [candidate division KSB1 bacterium]